jgi:broad specificity phosphatase PhoE
MHDPSLTELGERQCRELHANFPYQHRIGLVVASPLRRTIYTALLAFDDAVRHGVRVVALPEAQETSDLPCDTGSDPDVLKAEFDDLPVDLSLLKEGWNDKVGLLEESKM